MSLIDLQMFSIPLVPDKQHVALYIYKYIDQNNTS